MPQLGPAIPGLVAGQAVALDGQSSVVTLRFADVEATATLHPSVEPVVIRRAIERGELVIAQQASTGWLVIGVLRTSATPGLDVGDDYVIEARRLRVDVHDELWLIAGATEFVMHAFGTASLVAKEISARAKGVMRLVGIPLKLN